MGIISEVAGGVASANPVTAISQLGESLLDRFVPDPAQKQAAQAQVLQYQLQLQEAQIDAQNKLIASQAGDGESGARCIFLYAGIALYLFNYGFCHLLRLDSVQIPTAFHLIFATGILGPVGIEGFKTLSSIMSLPGESSVQIPGIKVVNKQ